MALHPSFLHRMDAVIYSYRLPLTAKKERLGLLLHFPETDAWGEAAPLPGRSPETFSQAREQLLSFFTSSSSQMLYPSVRFALESALAPALKTPVCVPLWTLISGTLKEILDQVEKAILSGAMHIKIKIGSLALTQAKEVLAKISAYPIHWRIDCNRAFSYAHAVQLFDGYPFLIEEPTHEIQKLNAFPFPFALDETLEERAIALEDCPRLHTLILKPTLLGGRAGCAPFVLWAKREKKNVLFTGAFESGIGTLQILSLAQELCGNAIQPLGLGTYCSFIEDLYAPRLLLDGLQLSVVNTPLVNRNLIQEIAHGRYHLPPLATCKTHAGSFSSHLS